MTQQELLRGEVIQSLIKGRINGTEAAKQIGATVRQVKNIKATVIKQGITGVIHKNRGKESNRKISAMKIKKKKSRARLMKFTEAILKKILVLFFALKNSTLFAH